MVYDISFEQPYALWLLFSLPLLVFTHLYFMHHAKKQAIRFGNFQTIQRVTGKKLLTKNIIMLLLRCFIVLLLVLAAAGTTLWREEDQNTTDIVFVIDTSASMAASDLDGTRIDAAKNAVATFIDRMNTSSRVGIVQFSGLAEVVQPMTTDLREAKTSLQNVKIRTVGGTDIAGAITAGTNLLATSKYGKTIILVTDGVASVSMYEDNPIPKAIAYAQSQHVIMHTIGVGTQATGAAAFIPGLAAQAQTFDEQNLKEMAAATGGVYSWAKNQDQLQAAYISVLQEGGSAFVPVQLSIGFVFIALVFVFCEWGLSNTRYRILP